MEILGVGYQEIFLILVLLLLFVGPERLPAMAYQIGRAVRTMQQYARAVRNEFSDEFEYIEEQYRTVRGQVDDARQALREEDRKMQAELRSSTSVDLPPLLAPPEGAAPANGANGTAHSEAVNGTTNAGFPPVVPPAVDAGTTAGEDKTPTPPMVF